MHRFARPSSFLVVLAVAVALGAVAGISAKGASSLLTGADIRDGSLTTADLKDFSVNANDVDGRSHLQFKGTYATERSDAYKPVKRYAFDACYMRAEDCADKLPRHVIAKTRINVPFTGHVFADGVVQLRALDQGGMTDFYGNCRVDIVTRGAAVPAGGFLRNAWSDSYSAWDMELDNFEPGQGRKPFHEFVRVDAADDIEVTTPGQYDVYLSCGATSGAGMTGADDQLEGRGRLVVRSMAN